MRKLMDSSKLSRIDVAIGKKSVRFFLLITISPGSFPKIGILSKNRKAAPSATMAIPAIIRILPNEAKFISNPAVVLP
jgi:hypothetical protein